MDMFKNQEWYFRNDSQEKWNSKLENIMLINKSTKTN